MIKDKKFHFIGIGGISMSGIAEILIKKGMIVTGSDMQESNNITNLRKLGINITIGENKKLIQDADIIIYTAAISENNEELKEAKRLNKKMYERATFLGLISKEYENVICIAGTHGKSTTTGMVSCCFLEDKKEPTIQIGAILPKINSNSYIGKNKYFIMESCEFKDSFLHFFPNTAIILNIDNDHLDYFKNLENIKKSFSKFINLLKENDNLIINNDDINCKDLNILNNINIITFGIKNESNLMALNITYDNFGYPEYDAYYHNKFLFHIKLNVFGIHNIYNSLATISTCLLYKINNESIIKGIENFKGVQRRFEFIGKYQNNVLVYDDYAHHPTEIKATYNSIKCINAHQNWVVFQSHTYSRTKQHLKEFASILKKFDNIIIAPIYPAREKNIYNVKEEQLVNLIKPYNKNVCYLDSFTKIVKFLKDNVKNNDIVLTMGAGPINKVGIELLKN